jgi:hypothetical protein
VFLLIESLFSANSASGKSHWDVWILFAGFFDATDSSDPPYPRIPAVWLARPAPQCDSWRQNSELCQRHGVCGWGSPTLSVVLVN